MQTQLYGKDFITTEDWTNEELETALDMATDLKRRFLAGEPHDHLLRAKTLYMLFFEESTRTRTSFETGMTQLGGHGVFLTPKATQIDHGENAQDTGTVLSRYGHGIAVRDCRTNIGQKYLYDLAKYANIPI
ncbi:MAG: ornithine carbamoyltransferase, partial [Anaerolineaceae bacterium]